MDQNQKDQLLNAMHRLKKEQSWPQIFSGVSRGEFFMLHKIEYLCRGENEEKPGTKISDLSAATEMSKPGVSQMLNTLEDKGLIERVMTKSDRRVVYVRLTEQGKEKLGETARQMSLLMGRIVEELGPEDTAELTRLIQKLNQIMSKLKLNNE